MSKKPQTAAMIIKVRTRLRRGLIDIRYHLSADDRDSQSFDNCACHNSRAADQQAALRVRSVFANSACQLPSSSVPTRSSSDCFCLLHSLTAGPDVVDGAR